MKKCSKCEQEKPLDQFSKREASRDKLDYYCRPCRSMYSYKSHKYNKKTCTWNDCINPHYAKGLCVLHTRRKKRGTDMDLVSKDSKQKYYKLKHRYKLDKETYDEMTKDGCHVCSSKERLHVDHDHSCCSQDRTCGKCIRGIVCHSCNNTLGKLEKGTISIVNEKKIQLLQYILDYELKKKSLG